MILRCNQKYWYVQGISKGASLDWEVIETFCVGQFLITGQKLQKQVGKKIAATAVAYVTRSQDAIVVEHDLQVRLAYRLCLWEEKKEGNFSWIWFQKDGSVILWFHCAGREARLKHEERRLCGENQSPNISQEAEKWRRDLDWYKPFIDTPQWPASSPSTSLSGDVTNLWLHPWISELFESKPPGSPPNIAVFVTWALWGTLAL